MNNGKHRNENKQTNKAPAFPLLILNALPPLAHFSLSPPLFQNFQLMYETDSIKIRFIQSATESTDRTLKSTACCLSHVRE